MSKIIQYTQLICLNGHQITDRLECSERGHQKHCDKCGKETISACPSCHAPILGDYDVPGVCAIGFSAEVPEYCASCGEAFPWTAKKANSIDGDIISIVITSDIYTHVRKLLDQGDYYHAVEESYKMVREKLRKLTTEEKATDVFGMSSEKKRYCEQLFGELEPSNDAEGDFWRGIGYIHLAIQFLRNEKAHTLAKPLDKNLAIHYIALASLAYDSIGSR